MALPQPKRLKTADPRIVTKYSLQINQQMRTSGFLKRFHAFKAQVESTPWDDPLEAQYNCLNAGDHAIRVAVEATVRKLPMGVVPWSPELQLHRNTIELWKMMVHKQKHVQVSVKRIHGSMTKTNICNAFTADLEQAENLLHQAHYQYKSVKKKAQLWRNNFLEDLATAKAEAKGTKSAKELRSLVHIETQRRSAGEIIMLDLDRILLLIAALRMKDLKHLRIQHSLPRLMRLL